MVMLAISTEAMTPATLRGRKGMAESGSEMRAKRIALTMKMLKPRNRAGKPPLEWRSFRVRRKEEVTVCCLAATGSASIAALGSSESGSMVGRGSKRASGDSMISSVGMRRPKV
jgi:hypothetical protein